MKTAIRFPLSVALLALALVLAGCAPKAATDVSKPDPAAQKGSPATGESKSNEPAKPALSSIPEALKHEAFQYSGLAVNKPLTYNFVRVAGSQPEEGTEVTELKSVDKDGASFTVTRTGSLSAMGDQEVLVKEDGIYVVSTAWGAPEKPARMMPAKLTVGSSWDYDHTLKKESQPSIRFKGTSKAIRVEKVKVPAGEFDALLVTDTVMQDTGTKKGTVSSKSWYAKDIGIVKMKIEMKDDKGQIVSSSVELAKVGN